MSEANGTSPQSRGVWSRAKKTRALPPDLEAYANALLENLEASAPGSPRITNLRLQIQQALRDYRDGDRDEVSLFLAIKGLEYRATIELQYDAAQLRWFVRQDLRGTPATEPEIDEICKTFIVGEQLTEEMLARTSNLAIGYWRLYADTVMKACRRERLFAVALAGAILLFFSWILTVGALELLQGINDLIYQRWNWSRLAGWYIGEHAFRFFALGCAGTVVSMSLAGRNVALAANRPFDDRYILWSTIPRLLIGGLAGILASKVVYVFAAIGEAPMEVVQIFLAFSGGFADRLFLQKLVDATWKVSGLTPTDEKTPAAVR